MWVIKMKQFKSRKIKKKNKIIKYVFIFFFFFAYVFAFKYSSDKKLKKDVLDPDVNYVSFNLSSTFSNKFSKAVNKPVSLLNSNVKQAVKIESKQTKVSDKKEENKVAEKVEKEIAPVVYVYNTHQTESYVDYSVYDAASLLSNKLNESGIPTYFEEQSVSTVLQQNNMKYYESYDVSKNYLKQAIANNANLKYFIDFHRDSVSKQKSTISYNGKNYAKVLFLIGLDNANYSANLQSTSSLNEIIEGKVPGISRGIMKKGGKGVDGVYNQDVSENLFLIEVGSNYNTKEEVQNTIEVICDSFIEYVRGAV